VASPAVSVLMSSYNAGGWLDAAVRSVLDQTFGDLELIVIDDGSTDGSASRLRAIGDPRLRVERQPRAGLTRALIRAAALARAPLLARLDADDLSAPDRLARQVAHLGAHPEIGLLGTAAREVTADGRECGVVRPPEADRALRRTLIRRNPFVHSSIVMRRDLVERAGGYDATFPVAQDYDLWLRLSELTRLANLPDVLVTRRLVPERVSAHREAERLHAEARARWRAIRRGGYPPWCAVFVVRPVLALAAPGGIRRWLRAARGS
jgi:glycosyltransferase involved in cell wall biosynthesis